MAGAGRSMLVSLSYSVDYFYTALHDTEFMVILDGEQLLVRLHTTSTLVDCYLLLTSSSRPVICLYWVRPYSKVWYSSTLMQSGSFYELSTRASICRTHGIILSMSRIVQTLLQENVWECDFGESFPKNKPAQHVFTHPYGARNHMYDEVAPLILGFLFM